MYEGWRALCRTIRHLGSGISRKRKKHALPVFEIAFVLVRLNYSVIAVWRAKAAECAPVKYWEIIANNLSKAGWSLGCLSQIAFKGHGLAPLRHRLLRIVVRVT